LKLLTHEIGAGTTAAGLKAGLPTIIVPFFGDQPFWGSCVAAQGVGPHPIPIKQLTKEKLADAIRFCTR
jgi:UDP:flavonoid glycosyltransferase YjiC (YdhE family)